MSGWTDLLSGKASIYLLDAVTKQWHDRGTSGHLIMYQSKQFPQDVRLKWSKNSTDLWWRLLNGILKPKGERAWVLKGLNIEENRDEIIAIRFSDITISSQFALHYNGIFPPHNQQQLYATQSIQRIDWECAVCTFKNDKTKTICCMCGLSIEASSKASIKLEKKRKKSKSKSKKPWICTECTFQNPSTTNKICGVCGAKKKKSSKSKWICSLCTLQNESKATRCAACHTLKLKESNPMMHMMMAPPPPIMPRNEGEGINAQQMITMIPKININGSSTSKSEFERVASDITCFNKNAKVIFATLRSVTKKLLKDDIRYRTLDTTNPTVIEKLVGFEGVLDFLMLLGFESDQMGMKLVCEQKPTQQIVKNAVEALNDYMNRLALGDIDKIKKEIEEEYQRTLGDIKEETQGDDDDDDADDNLTLEQIILWSTHESMRDNESMEALIITHKTITDSVTLLKQLKRRFFVPIPRDIAADADKVNEFRENVQKSIQLKVIKALRDWMKKFWEEDFSIKYSENGEEMHNEVLQWIKQLQDASSHSAAKWVKPWADTLLKEFTRFKEKGSKETKKKKRIKLIIEDDTDLLDVILPLPSGLEDGGRGSGVTLSMDNCEGIADQITLMDYQMFSGIEARECIGQCWKKANNKKRAPHILGLIQQFNHLTLFVQMQILLQSSLKERSKTIKYVIRMGERFKRLRNYNSLCGIYSALNSAPIHRLKVCWTRVPQKYLNMFENFKIIFSREFNHRNLRKLFHNSPAPAIPHVGLFLQDLVFIDDGNSNKIKIDNFKQHGDMVNFNKCVRIYDRVKHIRLYQTHPYIDCDDQNINIQNDFTLQSKLLLQFKKLKHVTEDHIWDMSSWIKKQDERDAKKQEML